MPPKKAQPKHVPAVPLWATPGGDPASIERTNRKKADALRKLQDSQDMCHKRFSLIESEAVLSLFRARSLKMLLFHWACGVDGARAAYQPMLEAHESFAFAKWELSQRDVWIDYFLFHAQLNALFTYMGHPSLKYDPFNRQWLPPEAPPEAELIEDDYPKRPLEEPSKLFFSIRNVF